MRVVRGRVYLSDCLLLPLPMLRFNVLGGGGLVWMPAAGFRIEARRSRCCGGPRGLGQTIGSAPPVPCCQYLVLGLLVFHSCEFDSCGAKLRPKAGVRHGLRLKSLA